MFKKMLAVIPGLAGALLPNVTCPACWPVYAGVLSALGLGFLMQGAYFYFVIGLLLSISLASLYHRAKTRHGYGPLWLGLFATVVILGGKAMQVSNIFLYGGAAVLVAASLWNNWPKRKNNKTTGGIEVVTCPSCHNNNQ